jgi:hypothetical protein
MSVHVVALWKVIVPEKGRGCSSINFRIMQLHIETLFLTIVNKIRHTGSLLGKAISERKH